MPWGETCREGRLCRGGGVCGEAEVERHPQVRGLRGEPVQPAGLRTGHAAGRGLLRQPQVVVAVPGSHLRGRRGAGRVQELGAELPHRVEQLEAAVADGLDDRFVGEAAQGLAGARSADVLGRREPEAAGEHRQLRPQLLLGRRAQLVAPGDGGAQRAVPVGGRPDGAEDAEPVAQPGEQLLDGHAAQPDGGELKGERYPVEPPAQLGDGGGVLRGEREARHRRPGPVDEQRDRVGVRGGRVVRRRHLKRADHQRVLGRQAEGGAARRQDAQPGRGLQQQRGELRAGLGEVLARVQQEQQLALGQVLREDLGRVARGLVGQPERL